MAFVLEFSESVRQLSTAETPPSGAEEVRAGWEPLAQAVLEALARGETHYTDRPGILPLRERVTAMLSSRFGVPMDPRDGAVITCGLVEARFVALQELIGAGDRLWSPAELLGRVAGASLVRRAELAADPKAAKLVYLASSIGEAGLREVLARVGAEGFVLYEVDESMSRFHPAQVEGFAARTITIGSLGYASWQMGYLVASGALAAGLRDFKQALTICSANLSQWAALALMEAR